MRKPKLLKLNRGEGKTTQLIDWLGLADRPCLITPTAERFRRIESKLSRELAGDIIFVCESNLEKIRGYNFSRIGIDDWWDFEKPKRVWQLALERVQQKDKVDQ